MSENTHAVSRAGETVSLKPKLDYLKELSGGDHDFITEIIEMFIADAPQAVAQSCQPLEKDNFELLRITVHKLKSSVQVVGGYHLATVIHEIESAACDKNSKPALLRQMLCTLDEGIRQMTGFLHSELAEMKRA